MSNKKIILVVAFNGFQPIEYRITKQLLEQAGHTVITACDREGKAVGGDGSKAAVDILVNDILFEDYNGLFFIGGPGALDHLDNEASYSLLRRWKDTGKPYGAICISPRILAKAGVLEGKRATGWNGDGELEEIFQSNGVTYSAEHVVIDGNVVTADGPPATEDFGEAIIRVAGK